MKKFLVYFSAAIAALEKWAAGILCVTVFLLILSNILVRFARIPVYWIDEAAIYAMIWMGFIAASYAVHAKKHIAVTLVFDRLNPGLKVQLERAINLAMLLLAVSLILMSWLWFDPLQLLDAGNIATFTEQTLNFVYTEPTVAIGVPKYYFWLIMPLFSLTISIHSLAHLLAPQEMQQQLDTKSCP